MSSIRNMPLPAKLAVIVAFFTAIFTWSIAWAADGDGDPSRAVALMKWAVPMLLLAGGFVLRHIVPVIAGFLARLINNSNLSAGRKQQIQDIAYEIYFHIEAVSKKTDTKNDDKLAVALKVFADRLKRAPGKEEVQVAKDTFAKLAGGSLQLVNKGMIE